MYSSAYSGVDLRLRFGLLSLPSLGLFLLLLELNCVALRLLAVIGRSIVSDTKYCLVSSMSVVVIIKSCVLLISFVSRLWPASSSFRRSPPSLILPVVPDTAANERPVRCYVLSVSSLPSPPPSVFSWRVSPIL